MSSLKRKLDQWADVGSTVGQISAIAATRARREFEDAKEFGLAAGSPSPDDYHASELSGDANIAEAFRVSISEDVGDPEEKLEQDLTIENKQPLQHPLELELSTWEADKSNLIIGEGSILLTLKIGDSVAFVGEYKLRVSQGAVTIYGAFLKPSQHVHHVFAPTSHALPIIRCLAGPAIIEVLQGDGSIQSLGRLSPLFRNLWAPSRPPHSTPDITGLHQGTFSLVKKSTDDNRSLCSVEIPEQWQQLFHASFHPEKQTSLQILVSGRKDVGKSTFCRILLNWLTSLQLNAEQGVHDQTSQDESQHRQSRLLVGTFYLDLDPGQTEFSPAGQISLIKIEAPVFGPPYTHAFLHENLPLKMIWAHAIGASSPVHDIEHYLECVLDLQQRFLSYVEHYRSSRLVINSPGWSSKGLGFELTQVLRQKLRVSDTVVLEDLDLDSDRNATYSSNRTHRIAPARVPYHNSLRTASELRQMQALSYFHSVVNQRGLLHWSPVPLDEHKKWTVRYGSDMSDVLAIQIKYGDMMTSDMLSRICHKWILALCTVELDQLVSDISGDSTDAYSQAIFFWSDTGSEAKSRLTIKNMRLIGWAFVCKMDAEQGTLELITPLTAEERSGLLAKTETGSSRLLLIRGPTDIPSWAYLESIYNEYGGQKGSTTSNPTESHHDVEPRKIKISLDQLPEHFDAAANENHVMEEVQYVRTVRRGEATRAGARHWTMKPRITRTGGRGLR